MGRLKLIDRLAARDLRARRGEAIMMMLLLTAAARRGLRARADAAHGSSPVMPPAWGLLGVVMVALAGIAALTAGPARASARQPVAEILDEEL